MKKLSNSFYFIIIYILILLVPLYKNNSMNEIDSLIKKISNKNLYKLYKDKDKNIIGEDKKKEEKEQPKDDNTTSQIEEYTKKIQDLNINIKKSNIIIIVLSIFAGILFLIIVIYSSIKCYIVCSRKSLADYRVSNISINKLGEVYIDDNVQDKDNKYIGNSINDYGAPIYANNNNNRRNKSDDNKEYTTFNPDNYVPPKEDQNLYKPYKNEEL